MRMYCSLICLKNGLDGLEAGIPQPLDSASEDLVFSLDNDFEVGWSCATSPNTPEAIIEDEFERDNRYENTETAKSRVTMKKEKDERIPFLLEESSTSAIAVPKAGDAFPPTPSPEF
jgi:hypothetical protein